MSDRCRIASEGAQQDDGDAPGTPSLQVESPWEWEAGAEQSSNARRYPERNLAEICLLLLLSPGSQGLAQPRIP